MALTAANLHTIKAGVVQLHFYITTDAIATVAGSGYFNDVTDRLRQGDAIIVSDTNVPTIDLVTVSSASGAATVTVVNGT